MKPLSLAATLVFFVAAIDPAQGCWWGVRYWGPPVYQSYYYAPPVMVYPPAYVLPMEWAPLPPPRVVPQSFNAPQPMPERKLPGKNSGTTPSDTVPYAEIKPATLAVPMDEMPERRIPKADLPLPKPMAELPMPKAEPMKVDPAKVEFTAPKSPVVTPELPNVQSPPLKLELPPIAKTERAAPNLVLPPLPAMPLPMPVTSQSKYRPEHNFDIQPLAGILNGNQYMLKFENHTGNEITLTVHGQTLTLAAKHSVTATVPAKFAWKLGEHSEETATVGDGVRGYVVGIRN